MANVEKLSVSLSKDLAKMVRGAVGTSGYTSSSEVIREALRDWKVKQAKQASDIGRLQKAWQEGVSDIGNEDFEEINNEADATSLVKDIAKRGRKKLTSKHIS